MNGVDMNWGSEFYDPTAPIDPLEHRWSQWCCKCNEWELSGGPYKRPWGSWVTGRNAGTTYAFTIAANASKCRKNVTSV